MNEILGVVHRDFLNGTQLTDWTRSETRLTYETTISVEISNTNSIFTDRRGPSQKYLRWHSREGRRQGEEGKEGGREVGVQVSK